MNLDLTDQVAFVAGSSRGIGKAIARTFLREGARVVITGRDAEALDVCKAGLQAEFDADHVFAIAGDMGDRNVIRLALEQTRQRWQRLDCIVANIGSGRGITGWEIGDDLWLSGFETNFHASARIATEALRHLTKARRGSVVFISSIAGMEGTPAPLAYSSAKAALQALTKNLAQQVADSGVRINAIAPGNILFAGGSWEKHLEDRRDAVLDYIAREVPMRRFGTPEEIADLAVFLSSPRASFITGACVVADGGQTRAF